MTERTHEDTSHLEGQRPRERQQKTGAGALPRDRVKRTTIPSHFPLLWSLVSLQV